jgi:hypothetical protein
VLVVQPSRWALYQREVTTREATPGERPTGVVELGKARGEQDVHSVDVLDEMLVPIGRAPAFVESTSPR